MHDPDICAGACASSDGWSAPHKRSPSIDSTWRGRRPDARDWVWVLYKTFHVAQLASSSRLFVARPGVGRPKRVWIPLGQRRASSNKCDVVVIGAGPWRG